MLQLACRKVSGSDPLPPPPVLLLPGAAAPIPGAEGQQRWARDTALGETVTGNPVVCTGTGTAKLLLALGIGMGMEVLAE